MEQLTLFDLMEQRSDFPCDNCVFDRCGRCVHVENEECYCVMGSFQIKLKDIICPRCGERMEVIQSVFGDDGAQCSCVPWLASQTDMLAEDWEIAEVRHG